MKRLPLVAAWFAGVLLSACGPTAAPTQPSADPASAGPASADPASAGPVTHLVVKETSLGKVPAKMLKGSDVVSPNADHVAWIDATVAPPRVVLDGKDQKLYLGAYPGSLKFSPDGKRFGYFAATGTKASIKATAVIDGKEGPDFDAVIGSEDDSHLYFSADGKRVAYVGIRGDLEKGGKSVVVVDGVAGKEHPGGISGNGVVWSLDGKRWAASFNNLVTKKAFVVIDDVAGPDYDGISATVLATFIGSDVVRRQYAAELMRHDISFSADGKHVAYAAHRGGTAVIVLDGKEVAKEEGIMRPTRDGNVEGGFSGLRVSPDGKRLAYTVSVPGGKTWEVVDGKKQKEYVQLDIGGGFSPDGKHFAYFGKPTPNQRVVVLDGVEGKVYDAPPLNDARPSDLTFSPDGTRLAARVHRGGKQLIVINGAEGKEYDLVLGFHFSPDGKRYTYSAKSGAKLFVVTDGTEGKVYADLDLNGPRFGPDGRHVAHWAATTAGQYRVAVGGVESKETYTQTLTPVAFVGPTTARGLALRGNEVFRVDVELGFGEVKKKDPPKVDNPDKPAPVVPPPTKVDPPKKDAPPPAKIDPPKKDVPPPAVVPAPANLARWQGEWQGVQSYVLTFTATDKTITGTLRHGPIGRTDPARLFDCVLADGVLKGKWESDPEFVEGNVNGKRFGTFEMTLKAGETPERDAIVGSCFEDPGSVLKGGKTWPWNFDRKSK